MIKKLITYCLLVAMVASCIEPIEFEVPQAEFQTVIEGLITDEPGPYTVKVSRALDLNADSSENNPYNGLFIKLFDDLGNCEELVEVEPGTYETTGQIIGEVGRSYHVVVETPEGNQFTSAPDEMMPVGDIDSIKIEYEKRTVINDFEEIAADVFNVLVDATSADNEGEDLVRWRYQGTYEVLTYPHLFEIQFPWSDLPLKSPFPCSGYIVVGGPEPGGVLMQVDPCECCTCWANEFEKYPQLASDQLISNNQFSNVKVGEVPINNATFYDKYLIQIEQMSLSRTAYNFFNLIKSQKLGATSLFQPPSGEIRGNVTSSNGDPVIGLVWASAVRTKRRFVYPEDIPYPVTPIQEAHKPCYDVYPNASTNRPKEWE